MHTTYNKGNAISVIVLIVLGGCILFSTPTRAQENAGVTGSPGATISINGKQLPPPPPKFGGKIEGNAARSKPWRPFHLHMKADPLIPNQAYEFAIEIWPTSNLFKAGHRICLEIASSDDQSELRHHTSLAALARNTILEGRFHPSRLLLPVIPAQ